jgi:hypothetical protein
MSKPTVTSCQFLAICFAVMTCTAIAGCSGAQSDEVEGPESVSEAMLRKLGQQYLFDTKMSSDQRAALMASLRVLSPIDSVRFFQELRVLQGMPLTDAAVETGPDTHMLEVDDAINRMAIETQTNRLRLPRSDIKDRLRISMGVDLDASYTSYTKTWRSGVGQESLDLTTQALCPPAYAYCTAATDFQDTDLKYNACQGGCTTGAAFDRVSNAACEFVDCDYRIWYATGSVRATRVDGMTTAADCVVNSWPTLLNSYVSYGYTRVLYGWGHTTACGVYSGTTLQTTTWAWEI